MSADTLVQRLRDKNRGWHPDQVEAADRIEALEAEVERLALDAARLDFLESLMARREYQNSRRPSESINSDMHFSDTSCHLFARTLVGTVAFSGQGDSVRAAITAAMAAQSESRS